MKNKINQKKTSIIAITFLAAICLVSTPSDVYGLLQSGASADIVLHPGESEIFNWVLINNSDDAIHLPMTFGGGNGTEFLSFPESVDIEAGRSFGIPITVTIPEDYQTEPHYYPDGISYEPRVRATLHGVSDSGSVVINIAMSKKINITVLPLYCGQHETYYNNTIVGTNLSEYIQGTNGKDLIFGEGGNDLIDGLKDSDCIYAGNGNDYIQTGMGSDTVYGGNGDDTIRTSGLAGTNTVFGEEGNDILYVAHKKGFDVLDGGNGTDVCALKFENATTSITNCEITE